MRRLLLPALILGVALVAVTGAVGKRTGAAAARGPFVLGFYFAGGAGEGLKGDSWSSGDVARLGCLNDRHYALAFEVRNRSSNTVTLLDARAPDPAPQVVDPVATQVRHAPRPPGMGLSSIAKPWSAIPARPVKVRPRRSAVVQSNFLMHRCGALRDGRTVDVPGIFRLRYRISGKTASQQVTQPHVGFVLVAGPTLRHCTPVTGAIKMLASDIGCAEARTAAPTCHRIKNGGDGPCSAAGRRWDCGNPTKQFQIQVCWYAGDQNPHWYRARWNIKKS